MSNILILGQGGREHAIAYVLRKDSNVKKVFVSPANSSVHPEYESIFLQLTSPFQEVIQFVRKNKIDLVVVGSEKYLADGIVDILENEKIPTFGPTKIAAQLETSKIFAKKLMQENGVPTAKFSEFSDFSKACSHIHSLEAPYVIKADGLAAGKGVFIAHSEKEAITALEFCLVKRGFESSGTNILIEEYLVGKELSILAFTDGLSIQFLRASRDHKKLLNGDKGPNTGGMGVYSHVDMCTSDIYTRVKEEVLKPIFNRLKKKGIEYRGVIYVGLMLLPDNSFKVLELNCRLGDPEAQCILPLLQTNLLTIFESTLERDLGDLKIVSNNHSSCTVVLASRGYPHRVESGDPIEGLERLDKDILVFHSGTKLTKHEVLQTNGGRVLSLTGIKKSLEDASSYVYANVKKIHFSGCQYRTDIGHNF